MHGTIHVRLVDTNTSQRRLPVFFDARSMRDCLKLDHEILNSVSQSTLRGRHSIFVPATPSNAVRGRDGGSSGVFYCQQGKTGSTSWMNVFYVRRGGTDGAAQLN